MIADLGARLSAGIGAGSQRNCADLHEEKTKKPMV